MVELSTLAIAIYQYAGFSNDYIFSNRRRPSKTSQMTYKICVIYDAPEERENSASRLKCIDWILAIIFSCLNANV